MALVRYTAQLSPGETIGVRFYGTLDLAVLYEDLLGTLLGNPVTADLVTGDLAFYAEPARYSLAALPDVTPITITITTPQGGATVSGLVTILTRVTGPVRTVTLEVDGTPVTSPWSSLTVPDGSHLLTAIATSTSGETATTSVPILVLQASPADTTPPAVTIISPVYGVAYPLSPLTIAATVTDAGGVASVQFFIDTAPFGVPFTAAPYSANWLATAGTHTILVQALDTSGNVGNASVIVTITPATGDLTLPAVAWTTPTEGETVGPDLVAFAIDATDNVGVASVQILIDGVPFGSPLTALPYTLNWPSIVGAHTLQAVAVDLAGNTAVATIHVTGLASDTTPPVVTIYTPTAGQTLRPGTITIGASATDDTGVASAQIFVDNLAVSGVLTVVPYTADWTATLGPHTILVRVADLVGNVGTGTLVVSVTPAPDVTPPTILFTTPIEGATLGVGQITLLAATASDNVGIAAVQFLVDTLPLGAPITTPPYQTQWTSTAGAHLIQATATDNAGNTAMATVHVTVSPAADTTPPTVAFTAPLSGATIPPGLTTLAANAGDNIAVASVQFYVDNAAQGSAVTAAPYQTGWTPTDGTYSLKATATDTSNNTASDTIPVTVVTPTPYPDATVLVPSDFTYLGYYDLYIDGLDSVFAQGFAMRRVGGDLRLLTVQNDLLLKEVSLAGHSFGDLITTFGTSWDVSTFLSNQGRNLAIWIDPATGKLWTWETVDYTVDFRDVRMFQCVLNANGTISNLHGPVGLEGLSAKRVFGGAQSVPASFQATYGVGPYVTGWGGYTSLVALGGIASLGGTCYAMPDPAGFADGTNIPAAQWKTLMDHASGTTATDWYTSGVITFDRGWRLNSPINYFDDPAQSGNPTSAPTVPPSAAAQWLSPAPDGHARMTWGDGYWGTGCWIEGGTKHGFVTIATLGSGRCWYGSSTLHADRRIHEWHIFDPVQFGQCVQGSRAPYKVQPANMGPLSGLPGLDDVSTYGLGVLGSINGAYYDDVTSRLYLMNPNNAAFGSNRLFVFSVSA